MAIPEKNILLEKYKQFQAERRNKHSVEYTLVDRDVFRLNTESMKKNKIVRSQIRASKKVPLEA
ncbi:hypothetical protein [Vibrio parahaemolyticus]|uniref:hypothetical protein n=1 Tax=Vibrio parahaemolyticus TaxID=670 RepID=UPI00235F63A8|nr:hypothetical protein [Vibrio parahaemolyticus]